MFVFKAAVVGAGMMGGEIAHTIANADIPVVFPAEAHLTLYRDVRAGSAR
jgi:3-hydroxyacyl-CoA dehydrogenase